MSEDEKAQQIGIALKQYSEAKIALAHLDTKLKSVSETYKQVGQAIEQSVSVRLKVEHGRVQLTYSPQFDCADLLCEADLVKLLNEKSEAEKLVAQLNQQLTSFGIPNVK
jgi:tetrahydromethanopterin S-methyltransferase subunit G